jgi:hypothetical protein
VSAGRGGVHEGVRGCVWSVDMFKHVHTVNCFMIFRNFIVAFVCITLSYCA